MPILVHGRGIDRTSKFAFVELHEKATTRVSGDFLRHPIEAVPYKFHPVRADNGIHLTTPGAGGSAAPLIEEATVRRFRHDNPSSGSTSPTSSTPTTCGEG